MANIMTKVGTQDNVVTYEHVCDTMADRNNINPKYITLGSVVIVLEGESGNVEVYMAKSDKTWKFLASITSSEGGGGGDEGDEGTDPIVDIAQADSAVLTE